MIIYRQEIRVDVMIDRKNFVVIIVLLLSTAFIAGCTSQSGSSYPQTAVPTTIQTAVPTTVTTLQTTALPVDTTLATAKPTETPADKELLHDKGMLTVTTYKAYNFKDMGYKFVNPGDTFRITIKSDNPVIGYAMNTEQASGLEGSQHIPHYESYSTKVQWGLVTPYMIFEKATDSSKEFTFENVEPLTYVVDARWLSYDKIYQSTPPFRYEITITNIYNPNQTRKTIY
jgi:hypothetical protein